MGLEESLRIDRIQGAPPPEGLSAGPGDPAEFRRLLEKLESLAKTPEQSPVEDVDQLESAVRNADDEFRQVMSLRRMLEAAYHRALP